jgi:hypothetical protein
MCQVLCIRKPEESIDLFMVEIMHMRHKFDVDTRLVCLSFMIGLIFGNEYWINSMRIKSFMLKL